MGKFQQGWVGLIPKGKSTVEMKPREAELSLSFLTWAKAKPGKPGPPILHAAQEFWSGWHFVQVSNDCLAFPLISTRAVVCGGAAGRPKGPVLLMKPRLPLRVAQSKNLRELSMTKVILNGSGPNAVLTTPWSQCVDAELGWWRRSPNGGLHMPSRTPKRCPLRLEQWVHRTASREQTGRGVPL